MGFIMGVICAMYMIAHIIQQQKTDREYMVYLNIWFSFEAPLPVNVMNVQKPPSRSMKNSVPRKNDILPSEWEAAKVKAS